MLINADNNVEAAADDVDEANTELIKVRLPKHSIAHPCNNSTHRDAHFPKRNIHVGS